MLAQLTQGRMQLLLLGRGCHQLAQGHVALQLVEADQLIEAPGQCGLALQQLLLVDSANQEKLAGRLVAGNARNGFGFVEQLLRAGNPLAQIVVALELPQSGCAKR
ncbi:hypothetical protein D3C71_1840910 [compost metagenome]